MPSEIAAAAPGVYRIEKDVNQGRVSLGLPTVKRDNPDIYALEVMNEILGGSGFGEDPLGLLLVDADPSDRQGMAGLGVNGHQRPIESGVAGGDVEMVLHEG